MGFGFPPSNARDMDAWYQTENGAMALRLQMALMLRLFGPLRGLRLLDVGCGNGHHLELFRQEGYYVAGLDCSKPLWPWLGNGWGSKCVFSTDEPKGFPSITMNTTLSRLSIPGIHGPSRNGPGRSLSRGQETRFGRSDQ